VGEGAAGADSFVLGSILARMRGEYGRNLPMFGLNEVLGVVLSPSPLPCSRLGSWLRNLSLAAVFAFSSEVTWPFEDSLASTVFSTFLLGRPTLSLILITSSLFMGSSVADGCPAVLSRGLLEARRAPGLGLILLEKLPTLSKPSLVTGVTALFSVRPDDRDLSLNDNLGRFDFLLLKPARPLAEVELMRR